MKIALYQSKYSLSPHVVTDWIEEAADYVRTTEAVEVEFVDLPAEVVTASRVKSIDNEITTLRADFTQALEDLIDQKQRLLAITYDGDA